MKTNVNIYQLERNFTLSWWRPLSYRNQSIDLQSKSMDWFLFDNGLRRERVNRESAEKNEKKLNWKKLSRNRTFWMEIKTYFCDKGSMLNKTC